MNLSPPMKLALLAALANGRTWTSTFCAKGHTTLVALERRGLIVISGGPRSGWYKLTPEGRAEAEQYTLRQEREP